MFEFKVMVPLDGSPEAEHAVAYLDSLRCLGESSVLLLSVADTTEDFTVSREPRHEPSTCTC